MASVVFSSLLFLAGCVIVCGIAPLHRAKEKIHNSYIIKVKNGYDVDDFAEQLKELWGSSAKLTHRYKRSFRGLAANLHTKEAVEMVQNHEAVEYVAENSVIRVSSPTISEMTSQETSSGVPWNLDRVDQARLPLDGKYNPPNKGKGVTVYVLDSGVLPNHSEFGSRAEACFDAVGVNGIDCTGHGTHVAAVVAGSTYGVASEARVCGVRVVGGQCGTDGTVADVMVGLDWVTRHVTKPAVATLSLNMYGEHISFSNTLDEFINATGVTVVVAAGNVDDNACAFMPSSNEQVITVGATKSDDTRWPSSNWGSCVDIFAPGADIKSAWMKDPKDTKTLSGTSEACPHVAGAAAILLAEDGFLSHSTVKARILALATKNVLLFNQGNATEAIDGTDNLMIRVGTHRANQPPPEEPQPQHEQQQRPQPQHEQQQRPLPQPQEPQSQPQQPQSHPQSQPQSHPQSQPQLQPQQPQLQPQQPQLQPQQPQLQPQQPQLQPQPQQLQQPHQPQQQPQQPQPQPQESKQPQPQPQQQPQQPPAFNDNYPISEERGGFVIIEKPSPEMILIPDAVPLN